MSLGNSEIIKKSRINPETRDALLRHKFFYERPIRRSDMTNYIDHTNLNDFDISVLSLLDNEQFDYRGMKIEYWFQDHKEGTGLSPHCDYNHFVREDGALEGPDWVHKQDMDRVTSPITIASYLDVSDDLVGGALVISEKTWFGIEAPLNLTDRDREEIMNSDLNIYEPVQDDVLYFHGSTNYHWIEKVVSGTRKSMMINFWID